VADESLVRREPSRRCDLLNHPPNVLELRSRLADPDGFVEAFAGAGNQVEVLLRDGGADGVCERNNQSRTGPECFKLLTGCVEVRVEAAVVQRDVEVDNVAVLERPCVGDACVKVGSARVGTLR
jgi:hypothetical protein